MSADYDNLLISKNLIDWKEILKHDRYLYNIYEIKIKNLYFYFVETGRLNVFEWDLKYLNSNISLINNSDCGSSIDLLYYCDGDNYEIINKISEDFIHDDFLDDEEREIAYGSFKELLEIGICKVDENIKLTDEELRIISLVFKLFSLYYNKIPDDIKTMITKIN